MEHGQRWRQRQLAALGRFMHDRDAWKQALAALAPAGMIERLRHALHRRRYPLRYTHLDRTAGTQASDRARQLAKQQRDLADIVAFAAAHTPYYAETLTPFLTPNGFDFGALPILHKDDVIRTGRAARRHRRPQPGQASATPAAPPASRWRFGTTTPNTS